MLSKPVFWNKFSGIILAILIFITLIVEFSVQPVKSDPETWTVDDDGPADFDTIQEAIDAADAGDIIFVKAGVYYEGVEVNKTVSLVGENRVNTIVEGGILVGFDYVPVAEGVGDRLRSVSVSNFTVQNGNGLWIENSDNCTLNRNTVRSCSCGISIYQSSNCILRDCNLTKNSWNLEVNSYGLIMDYYTHDIDISNTIDGKTIYYLVNRDNENIPNDAGYVAAINCTAVTVQNLNLSRNRPGILFAWTNNSIITNNELCYNMPTNVVLLNCKECQVVRNTILHPGEGYPTGIILGNSDDCTLDGNSIVCNNQVGIQLLNSSHCVVIGNNVQNSLGFYRQYGAIHLAGSDNCNVSGNYVSNTQTDGIYVAVSDYCTIQGNDIKNNTYCGIYIDYSNNGAVIGNNVSANLQGIYSMNICKHWKVAGNKAENNRAGGITLNVLYNSTIAANTATDNRWGIMLHYSADCALTENDVSHNEDEGIYLALGHGFLYDPPTQSLIAYFGNCTVYANKATNNTHGIKIVESANCTLRNNTMSDNTYNFDVSGSLLQDFISDIDVSNLVDGKPVYFLVNQHDRTIPADAGYVGIINSTNTSAQNLTLTNNGQGVLLAYASNCTISRNSMSNNLNGISLYNSTQNLIYHNNFINNDCHATAFTVFVHNGNFTFPNLPTVVTIKGGEHLNIWDDGYPSGGNYWDYHNPPDLYSGPGQNVTGSDMIGDEAYNTDRYPLIYPYDYVPSPDLNNDGIINIVDVAIVAKAFGSKPGHEYWNPIADIDINETINIVDVATVAKEFGKEWKGGT